MNYIHLKQYPMNNRTLQNPQSKSHGLAQYFSLRIAAPLSFYHPGV